MQKLFVPRLGYIMSTVTNSVADNWRKTKMKFYTLDLIQGYMTNYVRHSSMRAARKYARNNIYDTRVLSARMGDTDTALYGVRYNKTVRTLCQNEMYDEEAHFKP